MIYIIAIEPIDTRYTGHWLDHVPKQIAKYTGKAVTQIVGKQITNDVSAGAFLNFASTNIWKNDQASKIAELFAAGKIRNGDYFLFMDAWNPTAIEIRYMADMFNIQITMCGIWHAGSYDPWDFLGRKIKSKHWSYAVERSLYYGYDHNFFATDYHKDLFETTLNVRGRSRRVGFPMEYYTKMSELFDYDVDKKENIIVFPHRISPEKKPEIFHALSTLMPEYEFVICQEEKLTKSEYHALLRKSKIVFSANLQETLGIGVFEGMMAGCIPVVPNRLSYTEMYCSILKYNPSDSLTEIALMIDRIIKSYEEYDCAMQPNRDFIRDMYFTGTAMYEVIKNG